MREPVQDAQKTFPFARSRQARPGKPVTGVQARLEIVTPNLGRSSKTYEVEVIRAAAVRRHLWFWGARCTGDVL